MAPSWLKKNSLKNRDDQRTKAAELTLRQSIYPIVLVTILFFLWVSKRFDCNSIAHGLEFSLCASSGATTDLHQHNKDGLILICAINPQGFSYGLLDTLNKHFQNSLNITRARSSGLQAAYFGAYPVYLPQDTLTL
jgi:FHS family L-fucose permease-like MFS transporter